MTTATSPAVRIPIAPAPVLSPRVRHAMVSFRRLDALLASTVGLCGPRAHAPGEPAGPAKPLLWQLGLQRRGASSR